MDKKIRFPGADGLFSFLTAGAHNAWLAAIIRSSNDAIISKKLDGSITSWNPAAERMLGYTEDEMLGESIRIIIPDHLQQEEDAIIASIKEGKPVEQFETERIHKSGRLIAISAHVSPILDEHGKVVGASKIARDLSKEIENRRRIEESEFRFRMLADNISQFCWVADSTGHIFWYNKRWFDYTGTTLEDMEGWGWKSVHHPDHVDRVVEKIQHSWDTGEDWEDTFPLRRKDGEYRWFLSRAKPIYDSDGKIVRWFGTNTDITDERERQEQIRFLMREVNHRSKNMLALIQGIARQTGKKEHPEFIRKFEQRLQALAASQDLLTNMGWRGMTIDDLLNSQLGHLADLKDIQIFSEGADIRINSHCAQNLGMALHELSTNASKYGALSTDEGKVYVNWSLEHREGEDAPRLRIKWREEGGPPVTEPDHKGFGTTVINQMCRSAFSGEVTLDYRPEGLFWELVGSPARGLDLTYDEDQA